MPDPWGFWHYKALCGNWQTSRAIGEVPFGYSCMQAEPIELSEHARPGRHRERATFVQQGLVGTRTDALRWLLGKRPRDLVRVT